MKVDVLFLFITGICSVECFPVDGFHVQRLRVTLGIFDPCFNLQDQEYLFLHFLILRPP